MLGQFGQLQRPAGQPAEQVVGEQTFEEDAHGEVIEHDHRRAVATAGMAFAPEEHAGPAGQLEAQALQIAGPEAFVGDQARQFFEQDVDGAVRQVQDFVADIGQFIHFPGQIEAGTGPPGGEEALPLRRVAPGRDAEIEMRREVALENAAHALEHVLAAQVFKQAAPGPRFANPAAEFGPARLDQRLPGLGIGGSRHCYGQPGKMAKNEIIGERRFASQPVQVTGIGRLVAGLQAGEQDIAPAQDADHGLIQVGETGIVEGCIQVVDVDAAAGQTRPEFVLGPPGRRPGQRRSRRQRLGEGQMLETVQGVVMDEIADRRLRRQYVRQMLDPVGQAVADGQVVFGVHVRKRTGGRPDRRCRRSGRARAPARRR